MERILRNTGGLLTLLNYDANGTLADAGPGDGTAVIADSAGAAIAGNPFTAVHGPAGTYVITLPATLALLDRYDVVWTMPDTTKRYTSFEVVGAFLFSIAEFKAFHADLAGADPAEVRAVREAVEDTFHAERITLSAFRPQGRRQVLDGTGLDTLLLDRMDPIRIAAATIAGDALSEPDLGALQLDPSGLVRRPSYVAWPWGYGNVSVLWEYGERAVDAEVHRAALRLGRYMYRQAKTALDASERATAQFTDAGGYRLTIAGRDGYTGLPEVDAVLVRKGKRIPGIA